MREIHIVLVVFLVTFASCDKENEVNPAKCGDTVAVSNEDYNNTPTENLEINSLEIAGNCLKINYSATGCSGDTWELRLIDSEDIMESNPPQRNLRLVIKNEEVCDAWLSREISFDISPIRVEGNSVLLHLKDARDQKQILYEY